MEKRIDELEESVKTLAKYMKEEMRRLDKAKLEGPSGHVAVKNSEMRLHELEKDLIEQKNVISQIRDAVKKNTEFELKMLNLEESHNKLIKNKEIQHEDTPSENSIDEEQDTEILNIDKNIVEVKQRLKELESNLKNVSGRGNETDVMRIITHELADFAKMMDHKYPELATQDEFRKFTSDIEKKISMIEVPDLSMMENKVDILEKKMEQLVIMIRELYNKLPAVVE